MAKNECSEMEMEHNHKQVKSSSGNLSQSTKLGNEQKYKAPSQIKGKVPGGK